MNSKKLSVSFQRAIKGEIRDLGVISHNNRNFFAKNVDQSRSKNNITYKSIELKEFYHSLFDEALQKYNERKRSNEKIPDYYEHIKNSKKEKLFEEIIVGFGNMKENSVGSENWDLKKQLCEEYMREFEKRNPNLKVFNAILHLDEANPHLHIDFVPITHNKGKNGLPIKVSMKQALIEQGFVPEGKKRNQDVMWEDSEREYMTEILHRHNLERDIKGEHRPHLSITAYKKQCEELDIIRGKAEKIKSDLEILSQKGADDYSPEEVTLIKNQNDLMKEKIEKQREQINALVRRYDSPIVKFEVFEQDKLLFVARELENLHIQFAEESNALFVPEFALLQCKKIAANYKSISLSIREKIKMDIDVLVLSSESLEQLLDKLQALGYEIKRGQYLAVKSPDAERFTRLKSLGTPYLPENLEKRIANRDYFPSGVREKLETSTGIQREFHSEIQKVIFAVQGLAYQPRKTYANEIYNFGNDSVINNLSHQILTLEELKIYSRDQLYDAAEKFEREISEKQNQIGDLEKEIPALKGKIAAGNSSSDLKRRLELLPEYIDSLKSEIARDKRSLSRVSDVIKNYEQASGGDYLGKIIQEQQAAGIQQSTEDANRFDDKTQAETVKAPKKS